MKGKRDRKRALKAWRLVFFNMETDASACTCSHNGLPAVWHMRSCPIHVGVWALKP